MACNGAGEVFSGFLGQICKKCNGRKFSSEIDKITLKRVSIADVSSLTVGEAREKFIWVPKFRRVADLLVEFGLAHLPLDREWEGLASGERKKIKLVNAFDRARHTGVIYLVHDLLPGFYEEEIDCVAGVFERITKVGGTFLIADY